MEANCAYNVDIGTENQKIRKKVEVKKQAASVQQKFHHFFNNVFIKSIRGYQQVRKANNPKSVAGPAPQSKTSGKEKKSEINEYFSGFRCSPY